MRQTNFKKKNSPSALNVNIRSDCICSSISFNLRRPSSKHPRVSQKAYNCHRKRRGSLKYSSQFIHRICIYFLSLKGRTRVNKFVALACTHRRVAVCFWGSQWKCFFQIVIHKFRNTFQDCSNICRKVNLSSLRNKH